MIETIIQNYKAGNSHLTPTEVSSNPVQAFIRRSDKLDFQTGLYPIWVDFGNNAYVLAGYVSEKDKMLYHGKFTMETGKLILQVIFSETFNSFI